MKILLAGPRGFCAGVERAIEIVERALELFGAPVYVRKEIVHNRHVVEDLRSRGAVFVEELAEVPSGAVTIFSAHGVSPAVRKDAESRNLKVIDATCPLVTKVHLEALRFAKETREIILIGHEGHEEVEGTMGEAPERMHLVTCVADVAKLTLPSEVNIGVLTQTTLSVDDTRDILEALKLRFPALKTPKQDDICYATQNRQSVVKTLATEADLVLVVGAGNSSNSLRLVEVARDHGSTSYLVPDASHLRKEWIERAKTVAITAGASAPEVLVEGLVNQIKEWFPEEAEVEHRDLIEENVRFSLPSEVRG